MSTINFSKIDTFAINTALNIDKDGIISRCLEAKNILETLDKMYAVKAAINDSTPEISILNIRKIKDIDSILEVSNEDFAGKEVAGQIDVYRTNVLEKIDMYRSTIADSQIADANNILEAITTYKSVLAQFEESIADKQPITPARLSSAVNEDAVLNFKIMTSREYAASVVPFGNRLGYFLSFINPKISKQKFDAKEFATGVPFFRNEIYDEENELLFMEPIKLKNKSKLSLTGWNADNIAAAYNKFILNGAKLCGSIETMCGAIRKFVLSENEITNAQLTPVYTSIMNSISRYIYAQEVLMSMIYNLLNK